MVCVCVIYIYICILFIYIYVYMQAHTHTRRKHVWCRKTPPKPYPPETKLAEALFLARTRQANRRGPGMMRLEKVDPKAELKGQGPRSICMKSSFSGCREAKQCPPRTMIFLRSRRAEFLPWPLIAVSFASFATDQCIRPRRTDTTETWATDTPDETEQPDDTTAPAQGFVFPGNPNSVAWHTLI